ncbi:hypothetical protein [Novosphingobium sp. 9U]|uniref:hypothetical protein n=1 Tax=Novosphingobium sp. 9U TaxID=2653158 RepID=UPI0012EF3FAF|nr:hypothetical protein [Novosphingobium sp. 9U]VWX53264.1 exported hypothetical protein [Novosphingobium sp. 9U]
MRIMQAKNYFSLPMLTLLGACGSASAVTPDSSNHAHCMAALSVARQIAVDDRNPKLALQTTARSIYEGRQLKKAGSFDSAQAEAASFLKKVGGDWKVLGPLLTCGERQDAESEFQRLNESGHLMAAAMAVEPMCQNTASCRQPSK